jgi:hypothetical protein
MGRHYGELGKARTRDDTFGWFGNTIRVGSRVSDLGLLDFLDRADKVEVGDDSPEAKRQGMALVQDFLRGLVHPEDWSTFWAAALDNGQTMQDLMGVVVAITEKAADRPTRRRSVSSTGRRSTGARSKGDSSLRVIRDLEAEGRPDKALAVLRAQEARRAG